MPSRASKTLSLIVRDGEITPMSSVEVLARVGSGDFSSEGSLDVDDVPKGVS